MGNPEFAVIVTLENTDDAELENEVRCYRVEAKMLSDAMKKTREFVEETEKTFIVVKRIRGYAIYDDLKVVYEN